MVEAPEGRADYATIFPSYVAFDRDGNFSAAGLRAKERYRDGATDLVVRHFKRLIGRSFDHVAGEIAKGNLQFKEFKNRIVRGPKGDILLQVGTNKYSVVEIAGLFLQKIAEAATGKAHKLGEDIQGVTISLPAGYDGPQREATFAAAKAAGLSNIQVIEEPTAAAVARGVEGSEGLVMVVDVGAGTTDIVVGHIVKESGGLSLLMSSRKCDDLLGGMDMDQRVLAEYVMEQDRESPRFADIYPGLVEVEKHRLMAKIEQAKINASLDGHDHIALTLRMGDHKKRISLPLNRETLNQVVRPLVSGFRPNPDSERPKGLRPLVEEVLRELAYQDHRKMEQIKSQIKHLILVGGPCRMSLIHEELAEIFKNNAAICQELKRIDPHDEFFMEGVARGAALSYLANIDTQTPYPISVFHWETGRTPIIPKGAPYQREKGITRFTQVPVYPGLNRLFIVSEKDVDAPQWTMRSHMVHVPEEGEIKLTLHWSEGGTDLGKSSIEGAGLPMIEFPEVRDRTTLGTSFVHAFKGFLRAARDLRNIKDLPGLWEKVKEDIRGYAETPLTAADLNNFCSQLLTVPEADLKKCEEIDPEAMSGLSDGDVRRALREGYLKTRDDSWAIRCGLTEQAMKVLNMYFIWASIGACSIEDVLTASQRVLSSAQSLPACAKFIRQLRELLKESQAQPDNIKLGAALADALLAAAECLFDRNALDKETYEHAMIVFHSFDSES